MKKFFIAICLVALAGLFACNKDNGTDNPEINDKVTWESLVKQYPFLGNFPKFDGEIEMHQHSLNRGVECVQFFDYKCEQSVASTYYAKLVSAGFEKNENADIYTKEADGKEYVFTGGYAGGNFALSFNCISH